MSEKYPTIYQDDSYLVFGDEDGMVTLVLKDRGITIDFCDDCWLEFLEAMGVIMRNQLGIEV